MKPIPIFRSDVYWADKNFSAEDPVLSYEQALQTFAEDRESLGKIECTVNRILSSSTIAPLDQFNFVKKAATIVKNHGYCFRQDFRVPIATLDSNEVIRIPFSLLSHSDALKHQNDEEGESVDLLKISVPHALDACDFESYSLFLAKDRPPLDSAIPFNHSFVTWLRIAEVADRFCCDEEVSKKLNDQMPRPTGTLEELDLVLEKHPSYSSRITDPLVSKVLNTYIDRLLMGGHEMQRICDRLTNSHLFNARIGHVSISLSLQEKSVSLHNLRKLETILPNVESLSVSLEENCFFSIWKNTLRNLELKSSDRRYSVTISEELLSRIQSITLCRVDLYDRSTLDNRSNIKTINLHD